ncbi:dynein intermediate chain 3, ciliary [Drosophila sulfurigaster albostrigata]|uniref:dynein intermediate chain 3, ciliary n=1 Tax=Drosophila sulfurigaster albostrigata TaxID=89887 RepID=UPI002D21B0C0|nr:dynein intermediate chain 3, ciliary [Drosophila sulfurigaster albostrigata]
MYQNQVVLTRERRRFGRQCMFEDRNELMVSVHPSSRLRLKYIMGNPQTRGMQLSSIMASSEVETENATYDEHGMFHYEGGWPKEVNMNDEEQTLRHRKKVERDDAWGEEVKTLIRTTMNTARQNNAINIYNHFFDDIPYEVGRTICMPFKSRTINIIHDMWRPQRHMSVINWVPNNNKQIMTQYTNLYNLVDDDRKSRLVTEDPTNGSTNAFYVWDVKNPIKPLSYYDSMEVITCAKICPKEENNLAAGTYTGKVCIWDMLESGMTTGICPMEAAHRQRVSAITWVHSKLNTEFYSASLDGSIKFWDTRDLKMPSNEIFLETTPNMKQNRQDAHGCTVLEFEYTIPVRFIAGSAMGYVFVGNRKGLNPVEMLVGSYQICAGPIRTIHRNPFFVKNFLIVGDWIARIWCEEVKNRPSTMYVKKRNQLMCGAWSTGRASLFVTGDKEGVLDFWDLLLNQREPIYSVNFRSTVTAVVFQPGGQHLAVSLANGDTHIMNLDEAMKHTTSKEKALMAAMFEREITRSKLLEARVDEIKLRRRTQMLEEEEERQSKAAPVVQEYMPDLELDPDNPDQFIKMIESDEEFRVALSQFHETLEAVDRQRAAEKKVMERTHFEQYYLDNLAEQAKLEEARKKRAGSITSKEARELRAAKKKAAKAKGKK